MSIRSHVGEAAGLGKGWGLRNGSQYCVRVRWRLSRSYTRFGYGVEDGGEVAKWNTVVTLTRMPPNICGLSAQTRTDALCIESFTISA